MNVYLYHHIFGHPYSRWHCLNQNANYDSDVNETRTDIAIERALDAAAQSERGITFGQASTQNCNEQSHHSSQEDRFAAYPVRQTTPEQYCDKF